MPEGSHKASDGINQNYGSLLEPNDALMAKKNESKNSKISTTVDFVKKILKMKIK